MNLRGLLGGLIVLVLLGGVGTLLVDPFEDGDDLAATSQASSTTATSESAPSTSDAATSTSTATTTAATATTVAPAPSTPAPPTTQLVAPPPAQDTPRAAPAGTAGGTLAFTGPVDGAAAMGLALLALALAASAASRRAAL